MRSYGQLGLSDWSGSDPAFKNRARKCLGWLVAEDEGGLGLTLGARGEDKSRLKFIPMPTQNLTTDVERGFFVPIQDFQGGKLSSLKLFVVLLVREENCLGLRLEPPHGVGETHDYGHVQMSRELLGVKFPTVDWIPVSYPAFPTSTSEPFNLLLFMMTAIHGHSGKGGVLEMLEGIFRQKSRPNDVPECEARLRKLLGLS